MFILGIETSCDETAAAVLSKEADKGHEILSSIVWTQVSEHKKFGGVVPEIAARAHLEKLDFIIKEALREAKTDIKELSAIAVSGGPGLIGGVIVGVMTAKAIASALGVPFLAVNHLEGHALAVRIEHKVDFPFLLLLTSGGHCQILEVLGVGKYKKLGATIDDAAGEAFDKVAKMLDLGYPSGGALVEKTAEGGDAKRFLLPRPMKGRDNCDFSFSGLKTAVLHIIDKLKEQESFNSQTPSQRVLSQIDKRDICAGFQTAVIDVMRDRMQRAIEIFKTDCPTGNNIVVAGGVAANMGIRNMLEELAQENAMTFTAPALKFCTDNAAMIAYAGLERLSLGLTDSLDFRPRPRWALYE